MLALCARTIVYNEAFAARLKSARLFAKDSSSGKDMCHTCAKSSLRLSLTMHQVARESLTMHQVARERNKRGHFQADNLYHVVAAHVPSIWLPRWYPDLWVCMLLVHTMCCTLHHNSRAHTAQPSKGVAQADAIAGQGLLCAPALFLAIPSTFTLAPHGRMYCPFCPAAAS